MDSTIYHPASLPSRFTVQPAAEPTIDSHLSDLATIFAAAMLRLNARRYVPKETSLKLSESDANCLEFSGPTRLNGPRG